jgi:hypothetical protein
MKKSLCLAILLVFMFALIGCSNTKDVSSKDSNAKEFTTKLISPTTYEKITYDNIELNKYTAECKSAFGKYFTENGFGTLMANRVPTWYQSVIKYNNLNEVKDIKIIETANEEKNDYTYLSYEVSYILQGKEKSIQMKDYLVFKIVKEKNKYLINEFSTVNGKSSVVEEFKKVQLKK